MERQSILTTRGVKYVDEIVPGDELYDYISSAPVEILYINRHHEQLYRVVYIDGRIEVMGENEVKMLKGLRIPLYPIEFKHRIFDTDLLPYVAGALFGAGDMEDEYANLPIDKIEVAKNIALMQGLELDISKAGKVCFKPRYGDDDILKWNQLFPDMPDVSLGLPSMCTRYHYSSIESRKRFIMGVFDACYSDTFSPDEASILVENWNVASEIQSILNSLGVAATIIDYQDRYEIKLFGGVKYYPGLFNNISYIGRMINSDYDVMKTEGPFIELIDHVDILHGYTDCYTFETNSHLPVFSPSFLPRFYK